MLVLVMCVERDDVVHLSAFTQNWLLFYLYDDKLRLS